MRRWGCVGGDGGSFLRNPITDVAGLFPMLWGTLSVFGKDKKRALLQYLAFAPSWFVCWCWVGPLLPSPREANKGDPAVVVCCATWAWLSLDHGLVPALLPLRLRSVVFPPLPAAKAQPEYIRWRLALRVGALNYWPQGNRS